MKKLQESKLKSRQKELTKRLTGTKTMQQTIREGHILLDGDNAKKS